MLYTKAISALKGNYWKKLFLAAVYCRHYCKDFFNDFKRLWDVCLDEAPSCNLR